jgi:hypothetical protein
MTPTLQGRLQTRLFLAATVGVLWTTIIAPFLPEPAGVTMAMSYSMAFGSLLLMAVYGLVWEFLYQRLQQLRWDKDWPSIFVLLTVLNEAPLVWILDHTFPVMSGAMAGMSGTTAVQSGSLGLASPYLPGFAIHIGTTWVLMWLFSQGPMRVINVRWRFEGGRVVRSQVADKPVPEMPVAPGPVAVSRASVSSLVLYSGANGVRPASAAAGDLVEGFMCGHGHFGHPALRYCLICGRPLLRLTGTRRHGQRPPLGILIFDDGATHVLDGDVRLARAEGSGSVRPGRRDEIPAESALADIRLAGWQPVVSSELRPITMALPRGEQLDVTPGAPAPLLPGAEFTVAGHRIRYESPYQPTDPELTADGQYAEALVGADTTASMAAAAVPRVARPFH